MKRIIFSMCLACVPVSCVCGLADDEVPSFSKSPFDVTGKVAGEKTDQPETNQPNLGESSEGKPEVGENPVLDRKQVAARATIERKVAPNLKRAKLAKRSPSERPHVDDFFVVALFHMPLATREAELRFQVSQGVDSSTDQIADYIQATPKATVRDFQVVSRFKSGPDAEAGLEFTRKKYDEYKKYQAQMLAYMKESQAKSVRRC